MSQPETPGQPRKGIRWGLLIFLALVGLLILGGVLIIAGMGALMKGKTVNIKPDSTLVLVLDRPLQEPQPDPFLTEFFHAKIYSVYDLTMALDRAAKDDRIKSLLLDVGSFPTGFAKMQELRDAIQRFKASKKPVWAYFEFASNGGYYLCSSADKVYAPPSANLLLNGLAADVPFYRGVLDKVKVEPQLYHVGKYKSYSDTFMLKEMSEAQREATNAILDSLFGQLVSGVAQGRHLSEESVRQTIDAGFLWGEEIQKHGLVDGLWYKDQVEDGLKKVNGNSEKWQRVDVEDYIRDHRAGTTAGAKKSLALVLASGSIVSGDESAKVAMGDSSIGSDSMVRLLKKAGENKDIAAVVLRVDSPGGSALASDVIWRQVAVLRKTKPVVVSMSDVAASGGYYISMGADAIVAQPGSITGSIGVVSGKFVFRGLMDWMDYRQETLKRGQNADLFSAYDKFTPEQEKLIQGQMEGFYKTFVTKAAEGRRKTYDQVDQIAQGRIWSGEEALKIGLVDRLGGIDTAIALAKEKAKIGKDEPVRIQIYPRPKSLLEALFPNGADDLERARALSQLPPELVQIYRDYESIRPMASEPFVLYTPARVRM
jgi:protease IV